MKIVFTKHAKRRARERSIALRDIKTYIVQPDSVEPSKKNPRRFLFKKRYDNRLFKKPHLLLAVGEYEGDALVVITIIDTSRIAKYS